MRMTILAAFAVLVSLAPAQNLLADPGFENGDFSGWTGAFGNSFVEPAMASPPNSGNFSCKMFGPFAGPFGVSGVFEEFPCTPGQVFEMDSFSRHNSGDPVLGMGPPNDNWAVMKIAFFDAVGEIGGTAVEAFILDGTAPLDTWIDNAPIQATAPAGALTVQALILYVQSSAAGGSLFCDDVDFRLVPPPAPNLLSDPGFENGDFSGWTGSFGNSSVEPAMASPPNSGNFSCKVFGPFAGPYGVSGVFEEFPCAPGQVFEMDCFSRHNGGDPVLGMGPPNDNWAVMKIAFFDAVGEIGGTAVEATILDGTSPLDTWIDNAPIQATAPAGALTVQALILYVQPAIAGGALFCDDVEFRLLTPALPTYPGSGDDLVLATGVNGGALTTGASADVKAVFPGDLVEMNVSSGAAYPLVPYDLLGSLFPTGSPPAIVGGYPEVHLDLFSPLLIFVDGLAATPLGPANIINPNGGSSTYLLIPPGFSGQSLILQGVVVTPMSNNGVFAATDATELQF